MSSVALDHGFSPRRLPPGPRGHWLFGTTREFNRDPIAPLIAIHQQYGDAIRFRFILNFWGYSFTHPDHLKHFLQDNNRNYTKQPNPSNALLRAVIGDGLVTSDGDLWRRQRRLAQPAFHRRRIAGFGDTMTSATLAMLDRWRAHPLDQPLNIAHEMMRLTLEIVGRTLFSIDLTGAASTVGEAFTDVNEQTSLLSRRPFSPLALRIPFLPGTRRMKRGIARLDSVVGAILADRRAGNSEYDDLLYMLMSARDEETGLGMSDRQLRDEVMTLLLAGHETTAVALSWTFYLLSQHPDVWQALATEIDNVLGNETATVAVLPDLPYTKMVIEESMRLYPPAYIMARWGNEADEVDGYHVEPESAIVLFTFLTHRHPAFWPEPEKFDPQRFTPENVAERARYAYAPFGGGPRQCIGNSFAMTEAMLLLATIAQHYELHSFPGHQVELDPLITLRPKGGMPMYLHPRSR